jgi:hypothetical protein
LTENGRATCEPLASVREEQKAEIAAETSNPQGMVFSCVKKPLAIVMNFTEMCRSIELRVLEAMPASVKGIAGKFGIAFNLADVLTLAKSTIIIPFCPINIL